MFLPSGPAIKMLLRLHLKNCCRFIALVCSVWMYASVQAQELQVVTEHFPPFNYLENGQLTGYSTELLTAMLAQAGVPAQYSLLPWSRSYQQALTQSNTLIYSIARSEERDPLFEWIGPISKRRIFLFKLASRKDIQISSLAEAAKYKIGVVREFASTRLILQQGWLPERALDFAPSTESNLRKLLAARVDLIVGMDWVTLFELTQLLKEEQSLEAVCLIDDTAPLYFALNKQSDKELIRKLRLAFDKMKASGFLEKLKLKYLGQGYKLPP